MITHDELIRIARLAKLSLTDEDTDALLMDMSDIINVAQSIDNADLSSLNCTGEEEIAILRDDITATPLPTDMILKNAAKKQDGYFVGVTAATGKPQQEGDSIGVTAATAKPQQAGNSIGVTTATDKPQQDSDFAGVTAATGKPL
jgi:aspartyl-tRNA(Asn)/glutamyl-tRNA(Gln) amidotransferase subunit C